MASDGVNRISIINVYESITVRFKLANAYGKKASFMSLENVLFADNLTLVIIAKWDNLNRLRQHIFKITKRL